MPPESGSDPAAWLAAAREHIVIVENEADPIRLRCFHGQRAVELALKAILLHHEVDFPKTHALEQLILLVPGGAPVEVQRAAGLTSYAVEEMYPDTFHEVTIDHASEAVSLARVVIAWAVSIIEPAP